MIVSTKIAKMFKDCGFVNIDYLVESKLERSPSKILNILNRDWRKWVKPVCMLGDVKTMFDGGGLDPTFGYISPYVGKSSVGGQQCMWACRFTMPEAGNIMSITAYVKSYNGTKGSKTVIYADNAGLPASRLALSSEDIALTEVIAWQEYDILYSGVNTDYHLTFACEDGGEIGYGNAGGTNQRSIKLISDYTNPPNPFGTPTASADVNLLIYATYTKLAPKGTIAIHAKLAGII